jgi:hypothetical protein
MTVKEGIPSNITVYMGTIHDNRRGSDSTCSESPPTALGSPCGCGSLRNSHFTARSPSTKLALLVSRSRRRRFNLASCCPSRCACVTFRAVTFFQKVLFLQRDPQTQFRFEKSDVSYPSPSKPLTSVIPRTSVRPQGHRLLTLCPARVLNATTCLAYSFVSL